MEHYCGQMCSYCGLCILFTHCSRVFAFEKDVSYTCYSFLHIAHFCKKIAFKYNVLTVK